MLNLKPKIKMEKLLGIKRKDGVIIVYTPQREKGDGKFWCRKLKDFGSEYEYFYDSEFIRGEWQYFEITEKGVYEVCRTYEPTGESQRFFILVSGPAEYKATKDKKEMLRFLSELIGKPLKKANSGSQKSKSSNPYNAAKKYQRPRFLDLIGDTDVDDDEAPF
ncbi:MAG: hypothetical protein KatS3mg087_1903 [Patescibacteria group bacterium]|nr:MAG: hypothetical protein KatS3mg087_1903 [Patescibacteria group bacterium]